MKTIIITILITAFASASLAEEKRCPRNGQTYASGTIITENNRRYQCKKDGKWEIMKESTEPNQPKPPPSDGKTKRPINFFNPLPFF